MHIELLEPAQAEQDLKGLIVLYYGRYYGMELRVAEYHPNVYFILKDRERKFYFRSDFDTWQNFTKEEIAWKCMEIAYH